MGGLNGNRNSSHGAEDVAKKASYSNTTRSAQNSKPAKTFKSNLTKLAAAKPVLSTNSASTASSHSHLRKAEIRRNTS